MTKEEVSVFQYNSCVCLSESSIIGGVVIHQFQYNSCFCLSKIKFFYRNNSFFISMQLLFLFIGAVIYVHDRNSCDFNTTLVFVYCLSKIKFFYRNNSFFISMQLLFLFIGAVIYVHDRNSCDFNTTLVFVYPTFLSHSSVSIISLNLDIFNVFQLFSQPAVHFQN